MLLSVLAAPAVERARTNTSTALNVSGSWTGAIPGVNDIAAWTNVVTAGNTTSSLGADTSWRGIRIADPGAAVVINGNTLTVGNNGIDLSAATQNLTINSAFVLQAYAPQAWNVATGRTLTFGGSVTRGTGAVLNLPGTGTVNASSLTNDATGILGTWATYGTTTGARYVTVDGSGNLVGYTGTSVAAAAVGNSPTSNYEVAAVGALSAGASFNSLRYTGTAGTITGAFTANSLLNAGSGALTLSGATTIGASRELVVQSAVAMTLSGVVGDNASGPSRLTKGGTGALTLSNANTYTGITSIALGTVTISNASALGSTAGGTFIFSGDNSTPTAPGGNLTLNNNITVAEAISIFSGSGNSLAVLGSSGNNTLTGQLAVTGTGVRFSITSGVFTIAGGLVANNGQVVFNTGGTASYLINGNQVNLGSGTFYYDSGGSQVVVAVAGNVWGSTTVAGAGSGGRLRLDVSNVLPNTTTLTQGQAYAAGSIVDLNGTNQMVGSLASNTFLTTNTRTITSTAPGVLTVNQSGTTTSDAAFTGAVSLVKLGTGSLTLAGISTTTGSFTINRGTVVETFAYASAAATGATALTNNIASASPLILGGGTFQVTGRNNGTATTLASATWANDSNSITVTSTTGLAPGQLITGGTGLPAGAYVVAVTSGTTFIISAKTTAAQSTATALAVTNTNSFTSSQSFNTTTLNAGGSAVTVNANNGDGTVLNLGNITRNAGATLAFTLPTGTQSATNGITTNLTNTNGILGAWATVGNDWATNGTNLAGGNVVAFTSYTDVTRLSSGAKTIDSNVNAHVRIVEGTGSAASITPTAAGTTDIQTLLQASTGATVTYDPGTTDVLRLGAEGGILMSSAASALNIGAAANDGVLTAGGAANTDGTIFLTNNHTTNLLTINSTLANNGSGVVTLVKSGPGTAVLAGTNTYTGKTYIGGGKLSIASESALGTNPAALTSDQLILAAGTLLTTATFSIDDSNRGITLAPGGGTIETSTGTLTVATVISGTGELAKAGSGTLSLTAANTFTGETVISAGTLTLGNVNALQNSTLVTGSGSVSFGASGTNTYNLGGLRGSGAISLGANTLSIGSNNIATVYSGVLSGTGGLIKTGTAVTNLTGASTHSGDTRVNGGMLGIYNTNALQNSTLDTGTAGSQSVLFAPGVANFNVGGLKGSDDLDLGSSAVTVGANNQSTTFSGSITSSLNGSLVKVGSGTLALTGANTYNGTTTVSAGVLQVGSGGTGSTSTGAMSVTSGATLSGSGLVQASSATFATGATLRPGDSVANSSHATLTFTPVGSGAYNFQSGSAIVLSLTSATNASSIDASFGGNAMGSAGYNTYVDSIAGAGGHDRLVFNGGAGSTLTLSGSINVVSDSFTAQVGQVFNLIDWSGVTSTTFDPAFSANLIRDGLADNGSTFDLPDLQSATTGLYWDISRFTTSGAIVVVPEPGRCLLLLVGLLGMLLRRRK